jgi:beta-lactamase class A
MRYPVALFIAFAVACLRAGGASHDEFQESLVAVVKASGLDVGVAIKDLKSDEEFLVQPDVMFPQGSSIRIHLVTELFRQAAAGKLSLGDVRSLPESAVTGGSGVLRYLNREKVSMCLRDYAVMMIAVNDHSAANFLTDVVGMDNVNASLVAQGTPEIRLRRRVMSRRDYSASPENVGTPRSVMRALELIHRGAVVDRATSDGILEVLSVPEVSYFRREVPRGVMFAGRSGSGPTMRCDAGIVCLPDRPFVLCVMIKGLPFSGSYDYSKADALIATITQQAVRRYQPSGPERRRKTSGVVPIIRYTTTSSSSSNEAEFMLEKSSSKSACATLVGGS